MLNEAADADVTRTRSATGEKEYGRFMTADHEGSPLGECCRRGEVKEG